MKLPAVLRPTGVERINLPIRWYRNIPKATPCFRKWTGKTDGDTYGGKAVLNFYGKPEFAELGILRMMEQAGWSGVWVDTYRGAFRTQYWPENSVVLPSKQEKLLARIWEKAGSIAGCFDIFCWRSDGEFVFIESKRNRQDRIRDTQRRWLQAAHYNCRIPLKRFLIVEWTLDED